MDSWRLADENVAGPREARHIEAMSRLGVVRAYSSWTELTQVEQLFISRSMTRGAAVLDLGCGTGRLAWYLSDQFGSYTGVDASARMIQAAHLNAPDLDFRVGDIVNFDPGSDDFDIILLMHNVLDNLDPPARRSVLLRKILRWLRPGGMVIASSHLAPRGKAAGYYAESYHGLEVENFRTSFAGFVDEFEALGFTVHMAARDYREGDLADWMYISAGLGTRTD